MAIPSRTATTVRRWLLIFAAWTAVGVFLALQTSYSFSYRGRSEPVSVALRVHLTGAWTWFAFTPLILALSRRIGFARRRLIFRVAAHILLSLLFSVAGFVVFILVHRLLGTGRMPPTFMQGVISLVVMRLHVDMLRYWAVVAIHQLVRYRKELGERERAAASLRAELVEARLESLKRQLHPHFLFNTLNNISVLMYEDVSTAHRMLLRLSELLRGALRDNLPNEVTVEEELRFIEKYLEIEQIRFGDRLMVELMVENDTLDAQVPNLILQPLVENALKHGAGVITRPTTLRLHVYRRGSELGLEVSDDGGGAPESMVIGIGLSNTIARLQHLYGDDHQIDLEHPDSGGFAVRIAIPFRRGAAA
jgi:two-component system, LytTR family, sensor kinase